MTDQEKDIEQLELEGDEEEDEIVTMQDEDGNEFDFYVLATLDYQEKCYCVLEPAQPIEGFEEGEVLIYEVSETEDGEETLLPVENDAINDAVFEEFMAMVEKEDADDAGEDGDQA